MHNFVRRNDLISLSCGWISVFVLTLNSLYLKNGIIGFIASVLFFAIFSLLLEKYLYKVESGRLLLSFIVVFSFIMLFNLFFFYFFALTKFVIIFSIWITGLIITVPHVIIKNKSKIINPRQLKVESPIIIFNKIKILFPIILLLCFIQILTLFEIKSSGHIYHGFVSNLPFFAPYVLGVAFLILFLSIFSSIRNRYLIGACILLLIVSASTFVVISPNLYGADSWRHLAVENYIADGNKYEPTNVGDLLQFKSEKIPNASLHTIIPVLHHLTYLPIEYIHRFFQLLFLAPLFLLVLYFGMLDLLKSKQQSFLFVLFLLLSSGILYVGQYNSVQAVGIVYYFVNLWVWLRFLLGKTDRIPWYNWFISIFAILAYPTTGYFSLITILSILLVYFYRKKNKKFRPILYGLPLGIIFALPIPFLDIVLKKIPVDSTYTQDWVNLFSIVNDWWKTMFPLGINNPGLFPFIFILMLFGFIWLYKHEKNRLFPLLLILMVTLQISQWSGSIFQKDSIGIFTGRVQVLLSIFYYIGAYIGLRVLIIKVIKSYNKLLLVTIGTALALLFVSLTNVANYSFAWSISDNELDAINYIISVEKDDSKYNVLTDEVTSAAGTALTKFDKGIYYWYPGGTLYNIYYDLLKSPNKNTLTVACKLLKKKTIYFINTPIPLTKTYPEAIKSIDKIMSKEWSKDNIGVYKYICN